MSLGPERPAEVKIATGVGTLSPDDGASASDTGVGENTTTARQAHTHWPDDVDDHGGDLVTAAEDRDLKRGLGQRHLSMLGIAGAIGTGLFLGLGAAVQQGGPLGALLGYATVGLVVCAVQFALGEVSALLPVTGSVRPPMLQDLSKVEY